MKVSKQYPNLDIRMTGGSHEELYEDMMNKSIDLALNDQWRAFNSNFNNDLIVSAPSYMEVATGYMDKDTVEIPDISDLSAILICTLMTQVHEEDYYRKILGFTGAFLVARNLEEARMLVASGRGFLLIDQVGTLMNPIANIKRVPVYSEGRPLERNYCFFNPLENTNEYVKPFTDTFKELLNK